MIRCFYGKVSCTVIIFILCKRMFIVEESLVAILNIPRRLSICLICLTLVRLVLSFIFVTGFPYKKCGII